MQKIIKSLVCFGIMVIGQTALAQIVELTCPDVNALQFTQTNPNTFQVQGPVNIIKGSVPPINLYGSTNSNTAATFLGAEYIKNLQHRVFAFVCTYTHTAVNHIDNNKFSIQNNSTFGLEYCYFPNTLGKICNGDYHFCALRCEFL